MSEQVVLERRLRQTWSWTVPGAHLPVPRLDGTYRGAPRWRCRECGVVLHRYPTDFGEIRLRHSWRGNT